MKCRGRKAFSVLARLTHPRLLARGFAIIEILAALLLPALARAKAKAHQAQCANNLKQWGLAVTMYAGDNTDRFPDNSDAPDLAWLSPSMNTNFYPAYLYKNVQGTPGTG